MKKVYQSFAIVIIVLLNAHSVQAKILRVGFSGPAVAGVDYPNVGSAVGAASAGDTVQLYQNVNVGGANINKRLVLIGIGYNLAANPGLQILKETVDRPHFIFDPGSENSITQGVCGNFSIRTNNITISRSTGEVYIGYYPFSGGGFNVNEIKVISGWHGLYANSTAAVSNLLVSNCILWVADLSNATGLFANNVVHQNSAFKSMLVKNSVFVTNGYCPNSSTGSVFEHNIFRSSSCTITGANNLFNVDMNTVFVDVNNVGPESNLNLKPGSPAIGFGVDGNNNPTDAGIYGGEAGLVYKPSGIPAIPSIYQLTAPQLNATTNPYTITVSVRSNN